jgi:Transposase IS116/IS110/IS902 family
VNLICAATFIAAVGDVGRFLTSRKLVAYLGLDPKVRQSGEAPARSGRISKRGSAAARWALVEAAWSVVLQPCPLRSFYDRTRARRGHGKPIVVTPTRDRRRPAAPPRAARRSGRQLPRGARTGCHRRRVPVPRPTTGRDHRSELTTAASTATGGSQRAARRGRHATAGRQDASRLRGPLGRPARSARCRDLHSASWSADVATTIERTWDHAPLDWAYKVLSPLLRCDSRRPPPSGDLHGPPRPQRRTRRPPEGRSHRMQTRSTQ